MSEREIVIAPEDPRQADVRGMIAESDAYMASLYPAESNHLVDAEELARPDTVFLVARRNGELLGSIAFRVIARGHGEMKRLFVLPQARGFGLGRRLLVALEAAARGRAIERISLETGPKQPEAIGLYRSFGYEDCPAFGEYKPDPFSVFMTKRLDKH
jgi:putative acetyltransferase